MGLGGQRASVARGLGSRPFPPGPPSLPLAPRRNARLGSPELPRACLRIPGHRGRPAGAAAGMAGCRATVTVPGAAARRDDRRERSLAPEIPPGRCSGSEGPRSAHARRLAAAAPNFRQSFLPFLLEPAGDSERWPSARIASPGSGGAGAKKGVLAPGLVLPASPLRQREF